MATKKYTLNRTRFVGGRAPLRPGDAIELSERDAKPLLERKVIRAHDTKASGQKAQAKAVEPTGKASEPDAKPGAKPDGKKG